MTDFQFCRVCRVPRYFEEFTPHDYLEAGWVKEVFERYDISGEFFSRTEWLCPDCRKAELANERDHEEARLELIEKSRRNDPELYEKTMRERAS